MKKVTDLLRTIADIVEMDSAAQAVPKAETEYDGLIEYRISSKSDDRDSEKSETIPENLYSPSSRYISELAGLKQVVPEAVPEVVPEADGPIISVDSVITNILRETQTFLTDSESRFRSIGAIADYVGYTVGTILAALVGCTDFRVSVRRADNTVIVRLA